MVQYLTCLLVYVLSHMVTAYPGISSPSQHTDAEKHMSRRTDHPRRRTMHVANAIIFTVAGFRRPWTVGIIPVN